MFHIHVLSPQLLYCHPLGTMISYTVTHTPCIVCCCSCRIQRKVVSLCVYKHGDWLQLSTYHDRYDCINTLVIHCATCTAYCFPVPVDHTHLWYPVHLSQFYSVWNCVLLLQKTLLWKFCSFISLYMAIVYNALCVSCTLNLHVLINLSTLYSVVLN